MEKEIFGEYITFCHLDVFYASKIEKVPYEIYDFNKRENVCKIIYEKDKRELLCFWNPTEHYYYFIKVRNYRGGTARVLSPEMRMLEKWIAMKHNGIDAIRNDYIRLKKEREEKEEKLRLEREEREREENRRKMLKQQVKDNENKILKDARMHPEKYQTVKSFWDIPENIISKEIKRKLFHDEYSDEEQLKLGWYNVMGEALDSMDPYDRCTHMFYVADKDLSQCFKYKCLVSFARPGTYWGD